MTSVILVIHLILDIALVGIVLLQRSEGGALGMGGGGSGGGGMGGLMSGRAASDLLTRTTALIAAGFMATSLTLAVLASGDRKQGSILDKPQPVTETQAKPSEPSAPLAK